MEKILFLTIKYNLSHNIIVDWIIANKKVLIPIIPIITLIIGLFLDQLKNFAQDLCCKGLNIILSTLTWTFKVRWKLQKARKLSHSHEYKEAIEEYNEILKIINSISNVISDNITPWFFYPINKELADCEFNYINETSIDEDELLKICSNAITHYENALKEFMYNKTSKYREIRDHINKAHDKITGSKYKNYDYKQTNIDFAAQFLRESIKGYKFEEYNKVKFATMQKNLGICYITLANHTKISGEKEINIEKAIRALEEALRVYNEFESQKDYAEISNLIGNAYSGVPVLNEKNLFVAVRNYKNAIEIYSSNLKKYSEEYAATCYNLGHVYYFYFARRKQGLENTQISVDYLTEALKETKFDNDPKMFASINQKLGLCYYEIFSHKNNQDNLKKSTEAFEKALKGFKVTSDNYGNYYHVQTHIARNYVLLSEIENTQANLIQALNIYDLADEGFEQYSHDQDDRVYAKYHRAKAFLYLSTIMKSKLNIEKAKNDFEKALEVYKSSKEYEDDLYCKCSGYLGKSYIILAEFNNRRENITIGLNMIEKSINAVDENENPTNYIEILEIKGDLYLYLGKIRDKELNINIAIGIYNRVLEIKTLDKYPVDYAKIKNKLGQSYIELAKTKNVRQNILEGIKHINESTLMCSHIKNFVIEMANIKQNLGKAYYLLSDTGQKEENLILSKSYLDMTIKTIELEDFPLYYAKIMKDYGFWHLSHVKLMKRQNFAGNKILDEIKNAIRSFNIALKIYEEEEYLYEAAKVKCHNVIAILAQIEEMDLEKNIKNLLHKAENLINEALMVFDFDNSPLQYSDVLFNAGNYRLLGVQKDIYDLDELEEAKNFYNNALIIRTYDKYPIHYAKIKEKLGDYYFELYKKNQAESCLKDAMCNYEQSLSIFISENFPYNADEIRNKIKNTYKEMIVKF